MARNNVAGDLAAVGRIGLGCQGTFRFRANDINSHLWQMRGFPSS